MKTRFEFFPRQRLLAGLMIYGAAAWQGQAAPALSLAPGDAVEIRVMRHDDQLGGKFTLGADGRVELQLIGSVTLGGLTTEQARQRIEGLLADGWLKRPKVTVNISEFAKNTITVTGHVKNGAAFSVPRNKPFTVSQAIGMAGGFDSRANSKAVILKRGTKAFTINVKAIQADPSKDIPLQDGDVLTVKPSAF